MARRHQRPDRGPSQRQLRVAELIRRAISDVLARGEIHDPELEGASITVGEVRTTPDLKQASVYVLPLGGTGAEETIQALNRNRGELRRHVNRAVSLKFSPELRFVVDRTFDQMDRTCELLSDPKVAQDLKPED